MAGRYTFAQKKKDKNIENNRSNVFFFFFFFFYSTQKKKPSGRADVFRPFRSTQQSTHTQSRRRKKEVWLEIDLESLSLSLIPSMHSPATLIFSFLF
jgi:hypothetical protein